MNWQPFFGGWWREGRAHFRVWVPEAKSVELVLRSDPAKERLAMRGDLNGFFGLESETARPGQLYSFSVDGKAAWPDPASRCQPQGVHGPSQLMDASAFVWSDEAWEGIGPERLVIYELHAGTFTPEGTFAAATEKLPLLRDLGVTAIELMPVADFPGSRNWGYDGVSLFAPARCYGAPDDLRRLVDTAHGLGLAVHLDVVYNHLGPDGSYLAAFSRFFLSQRHQSPWGAALNFDGPQSEIVRRFFIENALHWIHEYHFDGLRLDATHAIVDDGPRHFLTELTEAIESSMQGERRKVVVVAEDDRNLAQIATPRTAGGWGLDAVWADDLHHEIHRCLTGESDGYFADFSGTTADIATTIRQGWFYCGQPAPFFGKNRGTTPWPLPPSAFVVCLQNHDQIGNRAMGERLNHLIDLPSYRAASVLLLLAPETPLLFMGQEWASSSPFQYFTDHNAELGRQVTEGRRREFARFASFSDPAARERIPDPQDPSTFTRSRLLWEEMEAEPYAGVRRLYKALLRLRSGEIALQDSSRSGFEVLPLGEDSLLLCRRSDTERLLVVVQLRNSGVHDLRGQALAGLPAGSAWDLVLTTEDPGFAVDPAPITVTLDSPQVNFTRPGAVILGATHALLPEVPELTEQPARIPVSTYRLQLNPGFGFRQAREIVPYLSALGITDCYASPIFAPRPGSTHGYDICDHNRLNPELGTSEDFQAFCDALQQHSMGLILDFVPNHMGIDPQVNLKWRSVLENGPSSPFASFFDIDWDPVKDELKDKVLLPILDDQYGNVLEAGQLQVRFEGGNFSLQYYDENLPLNPRQMRVLLRHRLDDLRGKLPEDDPDLREFLSIVFHLEHIPAFTETASEMVADRDREKAVASERLAALARKSSAIGEHIEENVREFNGKAGFPRSFDLLHELLDLQPYRLSYWKTAVHEINYRRFFDINTLAGIRMEDPAVFEATHILVGELTRQGLATGLRLDHVDGLFDPKQYFVNLQKHCAPESGALYVVVEKIISRGESLRQDWAIQGTTGYEFLNDVAGLFVDMASAAAMQKLYVRFTGRSGRFSDLVYESKKLIVATSMASELNVLAHELNRISESNRRYRDFTLDSLQEGLREVVACFPVYRSYFTAEEHDSYDEGAVDAAVSEALRRNPVLEPSMFAFIRQMLLPQMEPGLSEEDYQRRLRFAMKFQQYTGPVQAKGVEDTAFYRYGPLLSLNEVGGEPARFGRSVAEFHEINRKRKECWPLSMLCTSTHDTKRGEDARCRISVLSEIPDEYRNALSRWGRVNAGLKTLVHGAPAPDRANEYLYYQALLGSWPSESSDQVPPKFVERMQEYMLKAIKEEKIHTSWIHPAQQYDDAMRNFVRRTLTGQEGNRFLRWFLPFQRRVALAGAVNSLAQLVLKTVSPGVPDFYQGTELWDLNLVDPDNRRPVDYARRAASLHNVHSLLEGDCGAEQWRQSVLDMLSHWPNGDIKLFCTAAALNLRQRCSQLFLQGDYVPLEMRGKRSEHAVGLARQRGREAVIAIAPRLTAKLSSSRSPFPLGESCWGDTNVVLPPALSERRYRRLFTGESMTTGPMIPLGKLFSLLPVALMVAE